MKESRSSLIGCIAIGGFIGGVARYAIVDHWQTASGAFPWQIFVVNLIGVFILTGLLAWLSNRPKRYVRALIGTGFCGALTTFGSVMTGVDELATHSHVGVAVGYLLASLVASLLVGALGTRLVAR